MKVNGMKDRKVYADKIYDLEKNGGHIQAVGLVAVIRQSDNTLAV